jgi:hypothetical protein
MKTDNELIAEFMGLPLTKDEVKFTGGTQKVPFQKWKYDASWDWLMPVVEKIETLEHTVLIGQQYCEIKHQNYRTKHGKASAKTKIQAVFKAVVEFIKWHKNMPTSEITTEAVNQ